MPAVLLLVMGVVQFVLFLLASDVAQTAANKGALAGASYQASPGDGVERAGNWVGGQRLLREVSVSSGGSTADSVRITVTGSTITLLPGWTLTISESAEQPVEAVP
jgi:hypothetical protein